MHSTCISTLMFSEPNILLHMLQIKIIFRLNFLNQVNQITTTTTNFKYKYFKHYIQLISAQSLQIVITVFLTMEKFYRDEFPSPPSLECSFYPFNAVSTQFSNETTKDGEYHHFLITYVHEQIVNLLRLLFLQTTKEGSFAIQDVIKTRKFFKHIQRVTISFRCESINDCKMEFDRNKFDLVSALGNVDHSSTEIHILVSDFPKTKQQSSLKSFPRQLARAKFD